MKNKKTLNFVFTILCLSFISCDKDIVQQSWDGRTATTNCYILRDLAAEIYSQNNTDTILYSDLRIDLYFTGDLVSEGRDPNTVDIVDAYFVNVVKNIKITTNKNYNVSNDITEYFSTKSYQVDLINALNAKELGFSPKSLYLTTAPNNSDYYSFTIEITDIYDNYFVASTDSIFIEN
jgi:hypothetical protein